ncbi:hypothetical protein Tco_1553736 [Tanacetum coccineum]
MVPPQPGRGVRFLRDVRVSESLEDPLLRKLYLERSSKAITPDLPTEDSLCMGDEHLSTIPKKKSDEFIKSSVEDLVPIPSESEDILKSDSDCDLSFM